MAPATEIPAIPASGLRSALATNARLRRELRHLAGQAQNAGDFFAAARRMILRVEPALAKALSDDLLGAWLTAYRRTVDAAAEISPPEPPAVVSAPSDAPLPPSTRFPLIESAAADLDQRELLLP